jgi:hypothetical protein
LPSAASLVVLPRLTAHLALLAQSMATAITTRILLPSAEDALIAAQESLDPYLRTPVECDRVCRNYCYQFSSQYPFIGQVESSQKPN